MVERELIRRPARPLGTREQLALVVAADRQQRERDQQIGGRRRLERAGQDVAEVPDRIDPARREIGEHGLERPAVAMNVGDQRDSHGATLAPAPCAPAIQPARRADPVRTDWRRDQEWNALSPEAVHTPVLLLQAEHDPYAKLPSHAKLFARLGTTDRQWVVIPKGDHAALLEDTAPRLLAAMRAFLERP